MDSASKIPPSSAGIWGTLTGCTGWVKMNSRYSNISASESARYGKDSHELAEIILNKHEEDGVYFNNEMRYEVQTYINDIHRVTESRKGKLHVEFPIHAKSIHPDSRGAIDAVYVEDDDDVGYQKRIHIWDYKSGHAAVEVKENYQLVNYAAGMLDFLNIPKDKWASVKFILTIVQPRAYHRHGSIRRWEINASDLSNYFQVLSDKAHEALSGALTYRSGKHCRYCPGRHACLPALSAGMRLYEAATKEVPQDLSPEEISERLVIVERLHEHISNLKTGMEEQLFSLLKMGESVKKWKLAPKRSKTLWDIPAEDVIELGERNGLDLSKPLSTLTPKQALKAGLDKEVFENNIKIVGGGYKLEREDAQSPQDVFNNKSMEERT